MTEKRFTLKYINEQHISANLYDNKTFIGAIGMGEELIVELLNELSEENEQLKEALIELKEIGDYQYTRIKELSDENEQLEKELFEARKDYILETYADNPIRRDEKLKALEKELEE